MFQNVGVIGPQASAKHLPYHSLSNPLQFGNLQNPAPIANMENLSSGQGMNSTGIVTHTAQEVSVLSGHGLTSMNPQLPPSVNFGESSRQNAFHGISPPMTYGMDISPREDVSNSWANIVASSSKSEKLSLHYFKPSMNAKGIPSIKPYVVVAVAEYKQWSNCLVGSFLDKKLMFHVVQSIANRMWKKIWINRCNDE